VLQLHAQTDSTNSSSTAPGETEFKEAKAFYQGAGRPVDEAQARELYLKAANLGNVKAMNNLGLMMIEGRGGPRNPDEGMHWLEKAIAQGSLVAQDNLAAKLAAGREVPKDTARAMTLFRSAAEQGLPQAALHLGLELFHGRDGLKANPEEARKWLMQAAEKGLAKAQNTIGVICESDAQLAPEERPKRAAEWFLKAAKQGDAKAQANLGKLYSLGQGVERDPVHAYAWLSLSADAGEPTGRNLLFDFEQGLSPVQKQEGERLKESLRASFNQTSVQ